MKNYGRMLALVTCLLFLASCRQVPAAVSYTDEAVGEGHSVEKGSIAVIDYEGFLPNGTRFDSSMTRNQPFCFVVGTQEVIPGLNEGVIGMREGGERTVVVPPEFAYGDAGLGTVIPPDTELRYDIRLLSVLPSNLKTLDRNITSEEYATNQATTDFGVLVDLEKGNGSEIHLNNLLEFHATCWNSSGSKVDSTILGDSGNANAICAPRKLVLDQDHEQVFYALTGMKENGQRLIVLDNSTIAAGSISDAFCESTPADRVLVVVTRIEETSADSAPESTSEGIQ